jgi:hypothetical protein
VQLKTLRDFLAVLYVEVAPIGVSILGSFANSHLCLRGITQQEISKGVSTVGPPYRYKCRERRLDTRD